MNLARSTLKLYSARISKSIIGFTAVIIFSRKLGAEPLGIYYPFLALLGIVAIPADFGIKGAVGKRISEGKNMEQFLATSILLKLIILVPFVVIILFSSPYINEYLGANLANLFVLTLIFDQAGKLGIAVLRGELRVGETAIIELLHPLSWLVVGFILYTQNYGVSSLVYGYLIGSILVSVVSWWKVTTSIRKPTFRHAKSLLDFGRFSMISNVGGYIYNWMDVAILSLFVTLGTVSRGSIGAYENAWRVSLLVAMLGEAISTTLVPQFSRWDAEDSKNKIERTIPTAILASLAVVIPAFVGCLILSQEILGMLFGREFTVAWASLIILTGHKIPMAVHSIVNPTLNAIDRPDLPAIAATVTVLVNLFLNVPLIWKYGITGAAVATSVSFFINTILQTYYLSQFLKLSVPIRGVIWSTVSSGLMGLSIYLMTHIYSVNTLSELIILVGFGAAVYVPILFLNNSIRSISSKVLDRIKY